MAREKTELAGDHSHASHGGNFSHNSKVSAGEPLWGSVDKGRLPRAAFADPGQAGEKSTWGYPHHWIENAAQPDANGVWTAGTMFLHEGGLAAAWAAANGARTGQKASTDVLSHLRAHRKALGLAGNAAGPKGAVEIALVAGAATEEAPVAVEDGGDLGGPVIRNVALLTAGTASPKVGDPFDVDGITLRQACDLINASPGGEVSRLTHPELAEGIFNGYVDSILFLVGRVKNARVVGDQVRGDAHIGEYADSSPQGKLGAYLTGVARRSPADIGMSIRGWWTFDPPVNGGNRIGRLAAIGSVDFVGTAGGNSNGLLAGAGSGAAPAATGADDDGDDEPESSRADVPAGFSQDHATGDTEMTPQLKKYLVSLGLAAKATDAEAQTFLAGLKGDQKEIAEQLALAGKAPPAPAPAPASPAAPAPVALTDDQRRAIASEALTADGARRAEIVALAKAGGIDPEAARGWCDRGVTAQQAKELIDLAATHKLVKPGSGSRLEVGADRNLATIGPAMSDAMLRSSGVALVQFDLAGRPEWERPPEMVRDLNGHVTARRGGVLKIRQPHERAAQFGLSLMGTARRFLRDVGVQGLEDLSDDRIVELALNRNKLAQHMGDPMFLAMGTSDFPNALDTSIRIAIRTTYWEMQVEAYWQEFCAMQLNPDYRALGLVTMGDIPDLLARAEGEPLRYATVKDGKEKIVVTEFSRGYRFTKQMLKNDIRNVFTTFPQGVVRTARRKENLLPIATLIANPEMSDGEHLFSLAHGNLATGATGGGLGHATSDAGGFLRLQACLTAMRLQVGMNDDQDGDGGSAAIPLEIVALGLLVPAGQEFAARQALTSTVDPTKSNATSNPLSGYYKNGVRGLGQLALASGDAWYGYGDPNGMGGGLVLAFLQGEEAPTVASEIDFDSDDLKIKIEHKLGCAPSDYRGLYKNPGA